VVLKALFTVAVTGAVTLTASLDGGVTFTTMIVLTATTSQATYTMSVPSGTILSSVQVVVDAQASSGSGTISALVYEINIQ
jgi:outer membrane lipoprotein SlyB